MGRIHVLSETVANQIAAGEVVERPASVVKEMLENSLDSGATRIKINIEAGGKKVIQITDNCCGMERRLASGARRCPRSRRYRACDWRRARRRSLWEL